MKAQIVIFNAHDQMANKVGYTWALTKRQKQIQSCCAEALGRSDEALDTTTNVGNLEEN